MPITIRSATEAEQPAITAIVRTARINPRDLDWRRFLVAEEDGRIVGVGQIKPHHDGSRELASLAVIPERQKQGVGAAIVRALLAGENGALHLMCLDQLEPYYARFGFRRLAPDEMPPYFRRISRLAGIFRFAASLSGRQIQLIVMRLGN
jgi:N-acetylglutamate synthase-like GNAT family acetyltransferase